MTAQPNATQAEDLVTPIGRDDMPESGDLALNPEAALLCALMHSAPSDELDTVAAHLGAGDFENPRYGELFTVIAELITAGEGHDPQRIDAHMQDHGLVSGHHGALRRAALRSTMLLGTPALGIQARAVDILKAAYRRAYRAAAQRQMQAAEEAATDQLFDIILDAGTAMRTYTRRIAALEHA